jgi:two-component system sensor histidine kinase YesM
VKNRLIRVFVFHSLPLLITAFMLGGGAMLITSSFTVRDSEQDANNRLEQIRAYYELILTEMDSFSLMFSTSSEMVNNLYHVLGAERLDWIDANILKMIRSYITSPVNSRPYIDSVYVYLNNSRQQVLTNGSGITSLPAMADTSWYDSFVENRGHSESWAESTVINAAGRNSAGKRILRIYRIIYDTRPQPIGVIVLNLLADRLVQDYPSHFAGEGSFLIIRDKNGRDLLSIPASPRQTNQEYAVFSVVSRRFGWSYELIIPRQYLYRLPRSIGIMTVILSLAVCALGLLLTYKTNQKETQFLKNVLDQFEAAGVRRPNPSSMKGRGNVFDYLNSQILRTFLEQDYLRVQKEAMEYRALQMQINPHFLNNTLEAINWSAVALLDGPNDVSRMIRLLSRMLKYSMELSEMDGVSLEEEIEHTKYYLEIQEIRFKGRFSVNWRRGPVPESIRVPKLIFQPILENSFLHGFRDENYTLCININIWQEAPGAPDQAGWVVIEIADNGEGMNEEILNRLNSGDPAVPRGAIFIGLANIRKRVLLFYRGDAEFSIESEKKRGTKIRIVVPVGSSRLDTTAN